MAALLLAEMENSLDLSGGRDCCRMSELRVCELFSAFHGKFLFDDHSQTLLCCAVIGHHDVFDRQNDGGTVRIAEL